MKIKLIILIVAAFGLTSVFAQKNSKSQKPTIELKVNDEEKKVDVMIGDKLFTSYIYPDNIMKPVLWPVNSAGGNMLTRSYPLVNKAGDRTDHPHHVGIWLNYGDVNGLDFWNNSEAISPERKDRYGTIYHQLIHRAESGVGSATLTTKSVWKSPYGTKMLDEVTTFEFIAEGNTRIIDRTTTLQALIDKVEFTDNKEGMFAIRVSREMELPSDKPTTLTDSHGVPTRVEKMDNTYVKGNYRSSEGIEGAKVWSTRGRWMKLASEIKGEKVSIVIIDHPNNVGYPTHWHARDYGLFSANTLGPSVFSKGADPLNFTLKRDESVTFKYRMVIASDDLSDAEINKLADEYAN